MTLLEERPAELSRERPRPTSRRSGWCCVRRASDDAKALAALLNDRRIAENIARIPHPYQLADAERVHRARRTAAAGEQRSWSRCPTAR